MWAKDVKLLMFKESKYKQLFKHLKHTHSHIKGENWLKVQWQHVPAMDRKIQYFGNTLYGRGNILIHGVGTDIDANPKKGRQVLFHSSTHTPTLTLSLPFLCELLCVLRARLWLHHLDVFVSWLLVGFSKGKFRVAHILLNGAPDRQ